MRATAVPKDAESTLASQEFEVGVPKELRKERIDAAFGDALPSTEAKSPQVEKTTQSFLGDVQPKGIRLASPKVGRLIGFVTEQRWQGHVLSVTDETFYGRVFDTTSGFTDEIEEVEFSKDEVAELMRPLIVEGGVFFWDVGFETDAAGSRRRQSVISFPMIPVHSKQTQELAEERAKSKFKELGWGKQTTSERGATKDTA